MTQPTNDRPAQWRIKGGQPKGAMVTIPGLEPADVAQQDSVLVTLQDGTTVRKRVDSLERVFRTKAEEALGRDWTPEEVAENNERSRQMIYEFQREQSANAINETILKMAIRLERAAADLRHTLTLQSDPTEKVAHVQHEMNWMSANLGTDTLTREAIRWATTNALLGGESY